MNPSAKGVFAFGSLTHIMGWDQKIKFQLVVSVLALTHGEILATELGGILAPHGWPAATLGPDNGVEHMQVSMPIGSMQHTEY